MTRDERQQQCVENWKKQKYKGTLICATGFGKTRVAIIAIKRLLAKVPNATVLVIVPTEVLKNQWMQELGQNNLIKNCSVEIINTVIKNTYSVDLLILDECHRDVGDQFSIVFKCVNYRMILCLTATLNRLDEKEWIIKQYAPVCDIVSLSECKENGWVSDFSEYKILIDVDLTEYYTHHRNFTNHFSFFNFDFNLAMQVVANYNVKLQFAKESGNSLKDVSLHAAQFIKSLKARKEFIQNHPKKIELARKIINAFPDRKIITFSQTAKMANAIGIGSVYHTQIPKVRRAQIIEEFNNCKTGVINTVKAVEEGLDCKGLNLAINICGNSSQIARYQRLGRTIRREGDEKHALMFHLVIANTADEEWFRKSSKGLSYTSLYDSELDELLSGAFRREEISEEQKKHLFRF